MNPLRSQSHGVFGFGGDLCRSSSPMLLPKQTHQVAPCPGESLEDHQAGEPFVCGTQPWRAGGFSRNLMNRDSSKGIMDFLEAPN